MSAYHYSSHVHSIQILTAIAGLEMNGDPAGTVGTGAVIIGGDTVGPMQTAQPTKLQAMPAKTISFHIFVLILASRCNV